MWVHLPESTDRYDSALSSLILKGSECGGPKQGSWARTLEGNQERVCDLKGRLPREPACLRLKPSGDFQFTVGPCYGQAHIGQARSDVRPLSNKQYIRPPRVEREDLFDFWGWAE